MTMQMYYKEVDGKPVPCSREEGIAQWEKHEARRVGATDLSNGRWVSTVFMPLNHAFDDGPPMIYETMVFPGPDDKDSGGLDMDRYSTREEALAGHQRMVEKWGKPKLDIMKLTRF